MTIGGIAAAVVLGAVAGVLGRLLAPGRPGMPVWLTAGAGVVAAVAGTALFDMSGLGRAGWSLWEPVFQAGFAVAGVGLAAACWPQRG
ncbi:GlsB/YeaQ/YmgE family stress response membrane protein [Actinomadura fibrosa]|uniref:GlsB/YeaQ/YmgE family stress response membrane protein n=1 Tax=Actinomadura fibrosa TaxID=111802 RepID=A0ABW2XXA9_9ACTN|nr:GlsB/YeaQ/YmgE family stress response membrane protein [Actinomadura fibrosa]